MGMKKKCLSLVVMIVLFALFLSVSALADYDMWVESYYEITVAQTDSSRRFEDYYLFEGACTGLDFYISGDGTRFVLYGAPLVPDDYYFDVLLTYDDGGYEYMDFWVVVNTIEVVEPDPTQAPEVSGTDTTVPAPTDVPALAITKHPTGETVTAGNSAYFVARADNDSQIIWRVVKPDGTVYDAMEAPNYTSASLSVSGQGTETLTLSNIPLSMNGWSVECKFIGLNGSSSVISNRAKITVREAATPTPKPTASTTPAPTEEVKPTLGPETTPERVEIPAAAIVPSETDKPTSNATEKDAAVAETPAVPPEVAEAMVGVKNPNRRVDTMTLVLLVIGGALIVVLISVIVYMVVFRKAYSAPYRFRCNKCGWEPKNKKNIPHFCPNCGDIFDEKDLTVTGRRQQ